MKNKKLTRSIMLISSLASFSIFSSTLASNIIAKNTFNQVNYQSMKDSKDYVSNDPIRDSSADASLFIDSTAEVTGTLGYQINGSNITITSSDDNLSAQNPSLKAQVTLTIDGRPQQFTLTEIGNAAFRNIQYYKSFYGYLTLPNTLTSIGEWAFGECSLDNVILPSSLQKIGENAFGDCPIQSISMYNNPYFSLDHLGKNGYILVNGSDQSWDYKTPAVGAVAYGDIDLTEIKGNKIEDGLFFYCDGITSVKLPSNITIIGDCAFAQCSFIHNINLENITSIGFAAFSSCSGLTSLTLSKIQSIGDCAFQNFSDLTSIEFGDSLKFIDADAFEKCSNLSYLSFRWTKHQIEALHFNDIEAGWLTNTSAKFSEIIINVPPGQKNAYLQYKTQLKLDEINDDNIQESAYISASSWIDGATGFLECEFNGSNIELYDTRNIIATNPVISSIVSIDGSSYTLNNLIHNLFENNLDLDGILTIDSSITVIGPYVFNGCDNITEVHLTWTKEQLDEWFNNSNNDESFSIDPYWLGNLNNGTLNVLVPKDSVDAYDKYAAQLGINNCKITESIKQNYQVNLPLALGLGIGIPAILIIGIGSMFLAQKHKKQK